MSFVLQVEFIMKFSAAPAPFFFLSYTKFKYYGAVINRGADKSLT